MEIKPEQHGMNCPERALASEDLCTCAIKERIQIQTLETMLTAWQKRAYEAEAELEKSWKDHRVLGDEEVSKIKVMQDENERLRKALRTIAEWDKKTFPVVRSMHTGQLMPYGEGYGSNGERDFIKNIARDALSSEEKR